MICGRTLWIPVKDPDAPHYLVPFGDVHLGNEACDKDRAAEMIAWIADTPNCHWIGMGDYAEFIGYRDSRFDPTVVDKAMTIVDLGRLGRELTSRFADMVRPAASKCIGLLFGNHEDRYQLHQEQQDLHEDLCKSLGVQNLGYSAFQRLIFTAGGNEVRQYDIRAHHGAGWAVSDAGVASRLAMFMGQTDADLTLVGHLHRRDLRIKVVLAYDGRRVIQRVKLGLMIGTYLKTYAEGITTYAEKRGYDPTVLGSYRLPLRPCGERTIDDVLA